MNGVLDMILTGDLATRGVARRLSRGFSSFGVSPAVAETASARTRNDTLARMLPFQLPPALGKERPARLLVSPL